MSDETAPLPRIKVTWLIATLLAFSIFVVIGAYSKRMTNDYSTYDAQRAKQRYETLAKVQATEDSLINPVDKQGHITAEWVDETKGTIRLPIDEAMAKEVDDLKSKAPAMANALPNAAAAPVAPATNAPAAKAPEPSTPVPGHAKPNAEKKPASPAAAANKPAPPPTNPNH